MSVAKPCRFGSPDPVTFHSLDGLPVRQLSATMAFAGASQGNGGVGAPRASADRAAETPTPGMPGGMMLGVDVRRFETDVRAFASGGTFGNERTLGNAPDG